MAKTQSEKKAGRAEWLTILLVLCLGVGFTTIVGKGLEVVGIALPWWGWFGCWIAACIVGFSLLEPKVYGLLGFSSEKASDAEIEEFLKSPEGQGIGIANEAGEKLFVRTGLLFIWVCFLVAGVLKTTGVWFWVCVVLLVFSVPSLLLGWLLSSMISKPQKRYAVADMLKAAGLDMYRLAEKLRR